MSRTWQAKLEDQPGHADDWLMTYADMITLLLCFFAIVISVSAAKKDLPQRIEVALPVATPLPAPAPPRLATLKGDLPFYSLARAEAPAEEPIVEALTASAAAPARPNPPAAKTEAPLVAASPPAIDKPVPKGLAEIEPDGERITTIEISSAAFFDRGSAVLSKSGEAILRDVAADLASDKFKDYQITVEGHTDDTPISTPRFPSNWELSTARASAVVHFLLDQGIPAPRLRAAGYADTFPKLPNRDAGGNAIPENQSQNRRVVIKLEKIAKAKHAAAPAAPSSAGAAAL